MNIQMIFHIGDSLTFLLFLVILMRCFFFIFVMKFGFHIMHMFIVCLIEFEVDY
jgi:hypothetical protein